MKIFILMLFCTTAYSGSYTSYNVGLAHGFVKYAAERIPHVIDALKRENSDFYCIQEVWRPEDREQIIEALKGTHPHSFYSNPIQVEATQSPTCSLLELFGSDGFGRCIASNCIFKGSDDLSSCVLKECKKPMLKLIKENRECALGLMANVGGSPIGALLSVFNPFKGAPLFAYGGGNGLLLLSKSPLDHRDVFDFGDISTLNRRSVLKAEVNGINVFCSHLTANLGGSVFYAGAQRSWEYENGLQIKRLIGLARKENPPVMSMGDFNCSISKERIKADFDKNCKLFFENNYQNYFLSKNPECSFCKQNSLVETEADVLIDHIFTKGISISDSFLLFKELIPLEKIEGKHNISDHYGLKVIVK